MGNRTITISDELYARLQARAIPLEDTIETVIAKMCDQLDGMMVVEGSHTHMLAKAAHMLGYDSPAALFARVNEQEATTRRLFAKIGEQDEATRQAFARMGDQEATVRQAMTRTSETETVAKTAVAKMSEHTETVKRIIAEASGEAEAIAKARAAAAEIGGAYEQAIKDIESKYRDLMGAEAPKMFRTNRRIYLPVGAELLGEYQSQKVKAMVRIEGIEFNGEFFDNPSAAAVAAKKSLGASDKAAQTNGWTFWQIEMHPGLGFYQPLEVLRERQQKELSERTGGDQS